MKINLRPTFLTDKKQILNVLVLGIILTIFFLKIFFESQISKYPHGADCFTHYYELLYIKNLLLNEFTLQNPIDNFSKAFNFVYFTIKRPPLFYIVILTVNSLIPDLFLVANYIVPFIYFIITILFTFKTSEYLVKESGVFSALLLSLFPVSGAHINGISLYPGLIAIVICTFYYFFKSNFFENKKYSIILGVVFGIGLLTKEQFLLFFVGPFFVFFLDKFFSCKKINWRNFSYFSLCAFLIGFLPFAIFHIKTYIYHEPFVPNLSNILFQLFYYCKGIIDDLGLPLAIIFIFSLFYSLLRGQKHSLIFFSSWISFVLIGMLFKVQSGSWFQWYYISPVIPGFAIIIGTFLKNFYSKTFAIALIIALFLHLILSSPFKTHFEPYQEKTFKINQYLKQCTNIPKKILNIGLMRDSWECVLPCDLEVLLRADGYDNVIGGMGFPNIDIFTCKIKFDVFLFVTKHKNLFWMTEKLLKDQVDSLLPELKTRITQTDLERLLKREENLKLIKSFPYFYNKNKYFVHIYIKK